MLVYGSSYARFFEISYRMHLSKKEWDRDSSKNFIKENDFLNFNDL
jgi:hypothetical protein